MTKRQGRKALSFLFECGEYEPSVPEGQVCGLTNTSAMANQLTSVIQLVLNDDWRELSKKGAKSLQADFFSFLATDKKVLVSVYNCQPWHPSIGYFMVCDYSSLDDYQTFWGRLNQQAMLSKYADVVDIALGVDRKVDNEINPDGHPYCSMVKLALTDKWFGLAVQEKKSLMGELVLLIDGWGAKIDVRWLDADAWTDEYTDFLLVQFSSLSEYNDFWQEIRNHPYFASAYFRFRGTIMGAKSEVELTTLEL